MSERACLDAGVVARVFLPEEGRDRAQALLEHLLETKAEVVVPAFFAAEVLSTLRRKVVQQKITPEEGERAKGWVLALLATSGQVSAPEGYERAWALAVRLNLPTVYDAVYLAVAEAEGAVLWTADRKLYELARAASLGWVKLL